MYLHELLALEVGVNDLVVLLVLVLEERKRKTEEKEGESEGGKGGRNGFARGPGNVRLTCFNISMDKRLTKPTINTEHGIIFRGNDKKRPYQGQSTTNAYKWQQPCTDQHPKTEEGHSISSSIHIQLIILYPQTNLITSVRIVDITAPVIAVSVHLAFVVRHAWGCPQLIVRLREKREGGLLPLVG